MDIQELEFEFEFGCGVRGVFVFGVSFFFNGVAVCAGNRPLVGWGMGMWVGRAIIGFGVVAGMLAPSSCSTL